MIIFMADSGARPAEAVALEWRHVDLERRTAELYFRREVWHPALQLGGLETRAPYRLRHSYAMHSLQAGVPIATLARQMGHSNVSAPIRPMVGGCGRWAQTPPLCENLGRP
jgi:integrase